MVDANGQRKTVALELTQELADWLGKKEIDGYLKGALIDRILKVYIQAEKEGKISLLKSVQNIRSKSNSQMIEQERTDAT